MKYRLQITEKKNGIKVYVPQVYVEEVRGFLIKKIVSRWENIIRGIPSISNYSTSDSQTEFFRTEEEALQVIEGHKERIRIENGEKPDNITYKEVN